MKVRYAIKGSSPIQGEIELPVFPRLGDYIYPYGDLTQFHVVNILDDHIVIAYDRIADDGTFYMKQLDIRAGGYLD